MVAHQCLMIMGIDRGSYPQVVLKYDSCLHGSGLFNNHGDHVKKIPGGSSVHVIRVLM